MINKMIKLKNQINKANLFKEIEGEALDSYENNHDRIRFMAGARAMFNLLRDNRTKVTVETFEESGKHNVEETYCSDLEPHDLIEITREVREKYKLTINFTIEAERELIWNKWLVTE